MEFAGIPISVISLGISAGTFWVVFLRRGRHRMTEPTGAEVVMVIAAATGTREGLFSNRVWLAFDVLVKGA